MSHNATFSEDDVREILTSTASHRVMAERYGCHHTAIGHIRKGRTYKKVAPELPRWATEISCTACIHWTGERCDLGFPDPGLEGVAFARWCSSFTTSGGQ
jgi:hypothetical protein